MTDEVKEYAEKRILESGIRRVPGHYPDFESKEHVDDWLAMSKVMSVMSQAERTGITGEQMQVYLKKLTSLKRNKEQVPLDQLKTKYRKPYEQLKQELKAMTEDMLYMIVLSGIKIPREQAQEWERKVNETIEASGLLAEISHAVYRDQDIGQILGLAQKLKRLVWEV